MYGICDIEYGMWDMNMMSKYRMRSLPHAVLWKVSGAEAIGQATILNQHRSSMPDMTPDMTRMDDTDRFQLLTFPSSHPRRQVRSLYSFYVNVLKRCKSTKKTRKAFLQLIMLDVVKR